MKHKNYSEKYIVLCLQISNWKKEIVNEPNASENKSKISHMRNELQV